MQKGTTRKPRQTHKPQKQKHNDPPLEHFILPTELAFGSDGRIYANANGISEKSLKGRKIFHGYALTKEEAKRALAELHRVAFNLTIAAKPTLKRR